jgi:uncharacterized membrane protein YkoI
MRIAVSATPAVVAAVLLLWGHSLAAAANAAITLKAVQSAAQTQTQNEPKDEQDNTADIQAFENAKVSLADAITAAEKHTQGKAIDAAFADYNGTPAYQVKTFQHGAVWDGMIDATSGEVIGQGETTPENKLDREDKAELAAFQTAKQSLIQALKAAEQHTGGKAIDAGLEETEGKVVYEIEVVKNGELQSVEVNPESGQVIAAGNPRR